MRAARAGALLAWAFLGAGCESVRDLSKDDSTELASRDERFASRLASIASDSSDEPLARWWMPTELREISGLALTAEGRLLAHADERGVVFVLEPKRGEVVERFTLGKPAKSGDFEGITVARGIIYLISSKGVLYAFRQGADGDEVPVRVIDTRLGKECEFEGIAFDSTRSSLLLACKVVQQKRLGHHLVIYRWPLGESGGTLPPPLTIPLSAIVGKNGWKRLNPSDITVDPVTGHYVLVASQQKALIEITPDGRFVRAESLPEGHEMTEGIAISRDGILMLGDEVGKTPAAITLYPWRRAAIDTVRRAAADTVTS